MIRNYLKIAFRNLGRHPTYSLINIVGLAIGIAACLLILHYVSFELSYDDFHSKGDRIYRVRQDRYNEGVLSTQWAGGAFAVGNSFKDAFPEVEKYVKVLKSGSVIVGERQERLKVEKVYWASDAFFSVFSYPLLEGDTATALTRPNTVVITETVARQLFGQQSALGKSIRINDSQICEVTGVLQDLPVNSHLKINMLRSYVTFVNRILERSNGDNNPETAWQWDGCLTYLLLRPQADPQALEAKFPALVDKLAGEDHKKYKSAAVYLLQPLKDIHLYSHYMEEAEPNGDGTTVYLLLGVAFFIIFIAWVNYINLATARAVNRAREVGVRKAVGSRRGQLIRQFLTESALLNGLAVVLSLVLLALSLPLFNSLSGQDLSLSMLAEPGFWLMLLLLYGIGVYLSGLYPAFVLSGFNPVVVLKGKVNLTTGGGLTLRRSLVVVQFAASIFLLVGTFVVFRQIQFMRGQALGLSIDRMLIVNPPIVRNDSTYAQQMASFKQELLRQPAIRYVAASTVVPGEASDWNAGGIRLAGTDESKGKQYRVIGVDYDFVQAYGIRLLAGRNFSKEFGSDPKAVIFNKMALEHLGFQQPEQAIGRQIDFWGELFTIVGVTDNFHQQSLRDAYEPLILRLSPDVQGYFSIKIQAGAIRSSVERVEAQWNRFFPGNPFEYTFLDDRFNDQYQADQRFGQVFGLFTVLAILVACLGLFGLASFTIVQRTKEIGIRKVLGASLLEILQLFYREFALLVLLSFLVAAPLAWYSTDRWLQGYAFRVDPNWVVYVAPLLLVLTLALLIVSYQTLKAALMNPVKSLRSE